MNTLRCNICSSEVEQHDDGSGGYEIGMNKWFNTIEPWKAIIVLCKKCGREFTEKYGINIEFVDSQEPRIIQTANRSKAK